MLGTAKMTKADPLGVFAAEQWNVGVDKGGKVARQGIKFL